MNFAKKTCVKFRNKTNLVHTVKIKYSFSVPHSSKLRGFAWCEMSQQNA